MTHIFGARLGLSRRTRARFPSNDDFITGGSACARSSCCATRTARSARCSIAARIAARRCAARTKASARIFQCPYHGWSFLNTGKLRGVPWPDGYACDFKDSEIQRRAGAARRELSRLHLRHAQSRCAAAARLSRRRSRKPIDEWLDRNPGGKVVVCEANRLRYKGNWKLAYDNSGDGYHVVFSHRSLLEMENRQADDANKGMSYYKGSPDTAPMYMAYMGHGHHFKDKRPNIEKRAGGLWAVEGPHPGMEHYARGAAPPLRRAGRRRSSTSPLRAGEHQRVSEPLAARQPHPGVRAGLGR